MKDIRTPIRRRRRARRAVRAETRAPKGLADAGLPLDTPEPRRSSRRKASVQAPAAAFEPLPSAVESAPEIPWRHIVNSGTLAKFFVGLDGVVRFANTAAATFSSAAGFNGTIEGARFETMGPAFAAVSGSFGDPPRSPIESQASVGD
ncbi:MAG: hypothetical protein JNM69_09245, partial [Archangium sp.]|nr:hypothetical protein [Archangium sp.]